MTGDGDHTITEAALNAVGHFLAQAWDTGIGVTFEPDGNGWTVGYMHAMSGGELAKAYDLETAVKAAERPLDALSDRLDGRS